MYLDDWAAVAILLPSEDIVSRFQAPLYDSAAQVVPLSVERLSLPLLGRAAIRIVPSDDMTIFAQLPVPDPVWLVQVEPPSAEV
jgi:hypothetical protein